ncbi:unnamed protein product, partial [Effrenium voratum]
MQWRCLALVMITGAVRPKESSIDLSREERFQRLYRQYYAHYRKGIPRSMPGLAAREIPLQFEFEVSKRMYVMNMTPESLLARGGITSEDIDLGPVFESGSKWWYIEADGLGSKHHQILQGLPEANSVVVRPRTVLESSLPGDLVAYFHKLQVPASAHKTSFQFTVGVSAQQLPQLLRVAPPIRHLTTKVAALCRRRQPACSPQYEATVLLAAMILDRAHSCDACGFPKRWQTPWLVRTHMGDLAQTLALHERHNLTGDVLHVWHGDPDATLYPKGIMDYLHFPEMAEMGGLVNGRLAETEAPEMPVDTA